jgi:hypothetical protein
MGSKSNGEGGLRQRGAPIAVRLWMKPGMRQFQSMASPFRFQSHAGLKQSGNKKNAANSFENCLPRTVF